MRTLTCFAAVVMTLVGSATASAQIVNPVPLYKYHLYKSNSTTGWKWKHASSANDNDLATREKELIDDGHTKTDCGMPPADRRNRYTVCAHNICPDNGDDFCMMNCPTPEPRIVTMLPPGFYYQPCPPTPCVEVCQPVKCERPRLFPLFRRCR